MSEAGHSKGPHAHPEKDAKDPAAKPEVTKPEGKKPDIKKPETAKPEKKVFKAAVIDTSAIVEAQARDAGDARMTESKEDRSGNILKRTVTRIWKHGMFQEYYRQREISKAKEQIMKTGNIYAGEKGGADSQHKAATDAIVDRFTSEYDAEMLRAGETKQMASPEVTNKFKDLIKAYAEDPNMTEAAFREGQGRIMREVDPEHTPGTKMYSDNIYKIADEMRKSLKHGEKLDNNSYDVELTLGKARDTLKTEAQQHSFDRVVEKMQNSKVGKYFAHEPAVIAMGALAYSGVSALGLSVVRSNLLKFATFGATAALSGAVAGFKESARLERERGQHMRESAKGTKFEDGAPRRESMEQNRYETKNAKDITGSLEAGLAKISSGKATSGEVQGIMQTLADLESRVQLGDTKKADLISYSRFDQVEQERTQLDLARAKLKVALRKDPTAQELFGKDFNGYLDGLTNSARIDTQHNEMFSKNQIFKKMKHQKVAQRVISTMLIGGLAGIGLQEAASAFTPHQDGFLQGLFKNFGNHKGFKMDTTTAGLAPRATALENARRMLMGDFPRMPIGKAHEMLIGHNTHVALPEGVTMTENPDHTFNLVHGHDVLAKELPIKTDASGNLTHESQLALNRAGVFSDFSKVDGMVPHHVHEKAADYLKHSVGHRGVHRELWYDNDTPKPLYDQNELQEMWGGAHHTGINENGDYVFNVKGMKEFGSFHADQHVDAPAEMGGKHLKMLFSISKGTQDRVFEVMIDQDGNAIIPKDGEIAQLMFSQHNGHAVFHGAFAEVAQSTSPSTPDAIENVRILSTVEGPGRNVLDHVVPEPGHIPTLRLNIAEGWDADTPYFIPVPYRTPLEAAKDAAKDAKKAPKGLLNLPDPEPGLAKKAELEPIPAAIVPEPTAPKEVENKEAENSKENTEQYDEHVKDLERANDKDLTDAQFAKKLDLEFNKFIKSVPALSEPFAPLEERVKAYSASENDRRKAIEEFERKLDIQRDAVSKYGSFIQRIQERHPKAPDSELARIKNKFAGRYGFTDEMNARIDERVDAYRKGTFKRLNLDSWIYNPRVLAPRPSES